MVKAIALTKGYESIVDNEDYTELSKYRWVARVTPRSVYARRTQYSRGEKITVYMHRLLMNTPIGMEVDHIDGNGLNNTRENLREVTHSQNQHNRRSFTGISSRKGVSYHSRDQKWTAQLYTTEEDGLGKLIHLGYFNTEDEAADAYDVMASKVFGEYALLNTPPNVVSKIHPIASAQ